MDIEIPCFVTEGMDEADQKHALFLINHNASLFSDKVRLWQNAVEGGRDPIRERVTKMFHSKEIAGYTKDGTAVQGRKSTNGSYFKQGDLLVQYVFGENGRPPIGGGAGNYAVEWMSLDFALRMISTIWKDNKKKTDDIFVLGLIYFCAKNYKLWKNVDQAIEKCTKAFASRQVEDYINMAIRIMALKTSVDTGMPIKTSGRFSTLWHGPAGYLVFQRAYEKTFYKDKEKLYTGYTIPVGKKDAIFNMDKYKGIKKMLYKF